MGIEPTHKGFADLSLTTWVPRHPPKIIVQIAKDCQPTASLRAYFFAPAAILASRKNRAASSGGVGLM